MKCIFFVDKSTSPRVRVCSGFLKAGRRGLSAGFLFLQRFALLTEPLYPVRFCISTSVCKTSLRKSNPVFSPRLAKESSMIFMFGVGSGFLKAGRRGLSEENEIN